LGAVIKQIKSTRLSLLLDQEAVIFFNRGVRETRGEMKSSLVRAFFITAALILAIGAIMHAAAFQKIQEALFVSNLTPLAAVYLKVLWLANSATCLLVAVFFGGLALNPSSASHFAALVVALIPAGTAVMIYIFIGSLVGGHLLLAAALSAIAGTLLKS